MKTKKNNLKHDHYYKILPLALILLIIPLIVFLKTITQQDSTGLVASKQMDFFSYYKSVWLMVFTVVAIVFCTYYVYTKKIKFKLTNIMIPLLVYYLFVLLSTAFSKYSTVACWGFIDRHEGFFVISCYVIICFIAANFITYEKDLKILFGALIICSTLLFILGISQFLGFDFLQAKFFKLLMLPSENHNLADSLKFNFPNKYIYLTLYNPNFVGSFCAMILPISLVLLLTLKKVYAKILAGVFFCLSLVNLIGCRSSAGIIGSFVAVIVLIILLRKQILKLWIPILCLILCSTGALAFINIRSNGTIVSELKEVISQLTTPTTATAINPAYVTDIKIDKNRLSVYMGENPLTIAFDPSSSACSFVDSQNKDITIVKDPADASKFTFDDSRFNMLNIKMSSSIFTISAPNSSFNACISQQDGTFKMLNHLGKPVDIQYPESFGFKGKEMFASSRGYIWSRSIPLIKDTLLIGHGPDNFAMYFPQYEFAAKINYLSNPYMTVDKPHNMYMQMAINTGLVSLIAFLVFVFWYLINSFRMYYRPKFNNIFYRCGVCCTTAVIGFLVAAIANDSVVSVSPIFWILLGIGVGCNRLYTNEVLALESLNSQPRSSNKKAMKIVATK